MQLGTIEQFAKEIEKLDWIDDRILVRILSLFVKILYFVYSSEETILINFLINRES